MKKSLCLSIATCFAVIATAQDYKVGFVASGLSTTTDSVEIKNLNQNKSITVYGQDTLHLLGVVSSIAEADKPERFSVYPNPAQNFSMMEFYADQGGTARLNISDISGRQLLSKQLQARVGKNSWKIRGFAQGSYLLSLQQGEICQSRIIQAEGHGSGNLEIENTGYQANSNKSAKITNLVEWQYDEGDILLFKAWAYGRSRIAVYYINSDNNINFEFINCQDAEGHQYTVTTIDGVTWMAENLKSTRYINNSPITRLQDTEEWFNTTEGAYCYSNNDSLGFAADYGPLYNGEAVNSGNLCPNGWHIPTVAEYENLMVFLQNNGYNYDGSSDSDADPNTNNLISKSLSEDYSFDFSSNTGVPGHNDFPEYMNRSGFSALAAGQRHETNNFDYSVNYTGFYWTAYDGSNNFTFVIRWQTEGPAITFAGHTYGYSVRCVKD
jgi:uncharacterized protein (TIGR02145 family)